MTFIQNITSFAKKTAVNFAHSSTIAKVGFAGSTALMLGGAAYAAKEYRDIRTVDRFKNKGLLFVEGVGEVEVPDTVLGYGQQLRKKSARNAKTSMGFALLGLVGVVGSIALLRRH